MYNPISYRHFRLHLTPHSELFAENFHAYSIGEDNQRREVTVEKEGFYRGYAEGTYLIQ